MTKKKKKEGKRRKKKGAKKKPAAGWRERDRRAITDDVDGEGAELVKGTVAVTAAASKRRLMV